MPLPKISTSQHELVLPSTGKKIKFRPFLVREEKILILALESQDQKQISNAVKQVLKDCILTRGVKVDTLPSFDIEYIFLNVRGKSVGEQIEIVVTCGDDGETQVPAFINIDEVEVKTDPNHSPEIQLGEGYTLTMKYPSLNQFLEDNFTEEDDAGVEKSFQIIASSIDKVYNDDNVWGATDCTKKELVEWLESLTSEQFKKIERFFETMPKLTHEIIVTNPKTGKDNTVVLEGLSDFFA